MLGALSICIERICNGTFHMLMHADGILMLATSRRFLDSQPIEIDDITLKNEKS